MFLATNAGMGKYGILEESQATLGAVKSAAKPSEYKFDVYAGSAAHGRSHPPSK